MELYVKALHIIFVVTWFAGLFYAVRLFVYHSEAEKKESLERNILQNQYKLMEKRLWYGIAWPSLVLTYIFGTWLVLLKPGLLQEAFFLLKLCFVFGLTLYHLQCHAMYSQFQKNIVKYSSFRLRLWNEVATIFLVAIVFLIVLKKNTGLVWGMLGLILFIVALYFGVLLYRKNREGAPPKSPPSEGA